MSGNILTKIYKADCDFMKPYKLYIFDADGTLRRCTIPSQPCPNAPGQWELIPGVKEKLAEIDWTKTYFGIASNQAGVALGYVSMNMGYHLLHSMITALEIWPKYLNRHSILLCPHSIAMACNCRKPRPGMLNKIMLYFGVESNDTLFVGDMESDKQAAENAGCDFMWAKEFFKICHQNKP